MEEQFIPYEQALELENLGFDEPCFACYLDDKYLNIQYCKKQFHFHGQVVSAPLWQQAFDFFRYNYKMESSVSYAFENPKLPLYYSVVTKPGFTFIKSKEFSIYDEARLECLNTLIRLCKDQCD